MTVPRFSEGIPVTLGYISSQATDLQITPYPDYSWHSSQGANCDRITSVLRIAIDECGQLWVLDTGKIGDNQKCPPQLFVFDLRKNTLVRNYKFPKSQYVKDSLFINPVRKQFQKWCQLNIEFQIVDVKNPSNCCRNTKVYIADVNGFALIVYDFALNKSWKIQNSLVRVEVFLFPNFHFVHLKILSSSMLNLLSRSSRLLENLLSLVMGFLAWQSLRNATADTVRTVKASDFFTSTA